MSAKAVREYDGKLLLAHWLHRAPVPTTSSDSGSKFIQPTTRLAHISIDTSLLNDKAQFDQHVRSTLDQLEVNHPWLLTHKLVAKPDQLIKRRGKSGLLLLNADWAEARQWIEKHAAKDVLVSVCVYFLLPGGKSLFFSFFMHYGALHGRKGWTPMDRTEERKAGIWRCLVNKNQLTLWASLAKMN